MLLGRMTYQMVVLKDFIIKLWMNDKILAKVPTHTAELLNKLGLTYL